MKKKAVERVVPYSAYSPIMPREEFDAMSLEERRKKVRFALEHLVKYYTDEYKDAGMYCASDGSAILATERNRTNNKGRTNRISSISIREQGGEESFGVRISNGRVGMICALMLEGKNPRFLLELGISTQK